MASRTFRRPTSTICSCPGLCDAQDRLWQMDMARRMAAGEAAEILAEAGGARPHAARAGYARDGERLTASLDDRNRRYFDDYARG